MRHHVSVARLILTALPFLFAGCTSTPSARYIYQDGEYGVIGIPQNSPFGKKDFLNQAHTLMRRHFPEGYEIVRAEEVVEGQRVLDKSRTFEWATDPAISALNQQINLGKIAQTGSTQQKDSLPILESRIIYKRKNADEPAGADGFSTVSTLVPKLYLDPNEMARCREQIELAELTKTKDAATAALIAKAAEASKDKDKLKDPAVQQATHDAAPASATPASTPPAAPEPPKS